MHAATFLRMAVRKQPLSRLLDTDYKLFLYAVLYLQFEDHCQHGFHFEAGNMVK